MNNNPIGVVALGNKNKNKFDKILIDEIFKVRHEDFTPLIEKYKNWGGENQSSSQLISTQTKTQEAKPAVANTEYKPTGVLGIERGEFQQLAKELPKTPIQTAKQSAIQISTSSSTQKPSNISNLKTITEYKPVGVLGTERGEFQQLAKELPKSQEKPVTGKEFAKAIGTGFMAGVSQQNLGIFQIPRLIYNTASFVTDSILKLIFPGQIKDENNKIKMALNKAVEHYSNESKKYFTELEKMGQTEKVIGQAVATLPQVFTTILTSNALAGTSLASKLPELTQMIGFGATAAGQYAREAEERGATLPRQLAYGLFGGAAEMATESLPLEYALETITKTAPKLTSNLFKKGVNTVLKDFGILGLEMIRNAAMEAAEEAVNDPLIGLIDKALLDKSKPLLGEEGIINLRSMQESAISGGVAGLLLTSLGIPFSVTHSILENRIRNNQKLNSDDLLNITKDFIKNITGKDLDIGIEEIKGKKYIVFDRNDFEELQKELKQKLEKTTLEKPDEQPANTITQSEVAEEKQVAKPKKLKLSDEAKQVLNIFFDKLNAQNQSPSVESKDITETIKEAINDAISQDQSRSGEIRRAEIRGIQEEAKSEEPIITGGQEVESEEKAKEAPSSMPSQSQTKAVSPKVGGSYTVKIIRATGSLKEGQEYTGTVRRIYRAKSGAVLAELELVDGTTKSLPVSKYTEWYPVEDIPQAKVEKTTEVEPKPVPPEGLKDYPDLAAKAPLTTTEGQKLEETVTAPAQTHGLIHSRIIQRGKKGAVRVIFPDEPHARLFDLWSRIKKSIGGLIDYSVDDWSNYLRRQFQLPADVNLGAIASEYRDAIIKAVRNLPAGEVFNAPRLEEVVDISKAPRLSTQSQEAIKETTVTETKEIKRELEELSPQEIIELLKKHEVNGFLDNSNPDVIKLLTFLGTKETGVRLADAEEAGLMRYLLDKNEITYDKWIDYLRDLLNSNKIRDKELLRRNYPEVFEEKTKEEVKEIKKEGGAVIEKNRITARPDDIVKISPQSTTTETPKVEKEPWQMTMEEFVSLIEKLYKYGQEFEQLIKQTHVIAKVPTTATKAERQEIIKQAQQEAEEISKRVEQLYNILDYYGQKLKPAKGEVGVQAMRRAIIKAALSEGKPVPEEVLKDYPDLLEQFKQKVPEKTLYRYYLTLRPPSPGAQPKGFINAVSFDEKKYIDDIGREAWGYVEYDRPIENPEEWDMVPDKNTIANIGMDNVKKQEIEKSEETTLQQGEKIETTPTVKEESQDIAKLISESKLPEIEPTIINNGYRKGKPQKLVLEITQIKNGIAIVDRADFDFIDAQNVRHEIKHGFVIDGKKIEFIGNAKDIIKYAKGFKGETYDIRELLKQNNYKWNGNNKTWENIGGNESEKKIHSTFTGLDHRLALRSPKAGEEGYERLNITRGKILADDEAYKLDEKISSKLRKHQIDGARLAIAAIENYGGFLLADGTGAGKTMQELAVADYFSKKGKVLIVTINRGTINTAFKKDAALLGLTVNEITEKLDSGINITTYASLNKLKDKPDYIIFDESHSLKNKESARANYGFKLAKNAKGVLFASATPIDKAEHIFYLEKLGIFNKTKFSRIMEKLGYKYKEINSGRKTIGTWQRVVSPEEAEQRIDELFSELEDLGLFIKREVLMDNVTVEFKKIKMPEKVHDILDSIEAFYIMRIKQPGLLKALTLMAQRRFQEPFKKDIVVKLTEEELKQGRQVVIFATRIEDTSLSGRIEGYDKEVMRSEGTLNALVEEFKKKGIEVAKIFGSGKIENEISKFQEGKAKVALVTPQKGGAGLSLDDTVGNSPRTMIVITAPFSGVDNVQMAGRINRLNTKSKSKIIYLFADTAVDDWNRDIITEKMKTLKAIVKGEIEKLDASDVKIDVDEQELNKLLEETSKEFENSKTIVEDEEEVLGYSPKSENVKEIINKATNISYKKAQNIQKNPLHRTEIVEEMAKILNIPIRYKRIPAKKALGVFVIHPETIRLRDVDIDTLAHEAGHYLDKKFNISDLLVKYPYEAQTLTSGVNVNDTNFTKEAFAEFIRLYLTQPQNLEDMAPKFKKAFEDIIKSVPELKKVLDKAQEIYSQYYSQTVAERAENFVSFKAKDGKVKVDFKDLTQNLYKLWIDEAKPLYDFTAEALKNLGTIPASMNPYIRYRLLKGWAGQAMANLEYGVTNPETFKVIGPSFKEIIDAFKNEQELQDFSRYLAYIRALELNNRGIKSGLTNEEAQQGLIALKNKYKKDFTKFKIQAEKIYKYNMALLKMLQISGIISEKTYNRIVSQNKFYVPFFRVNKESTPAQTKNVVDINKPVYRIKGSNAEIINPLESIIKLTYIFTSVAERNLTANTIATLAETVPGLGKYVEKVTPKKSPLKINAKEFVDKLEKILLSEGIEDSISIPSQVDLEEILVTIFRPVLKGNKAENVAVIYREGTPVLYQFSNELYDLLAKFDSKTKGIWGSLIKALSYPASLLRSGAVLTPDFALKNILRDQLSAYLYSKYGYIPYLDAIKGLSHVLKKDDLYKDFYRSGAAQAALVSIDRDYLSKSISKMLTEKDIKGIAKEYITNPLVLLQQIAEASEESTRIAEFKKGYERELKNIQNEIKEYEEKIKQYSEYLKELTSRKNTIGTNTQDEIYRTEGKIKFLKQALEYLKNNSEAEAKRRAAFAAREVTLDFRRAGTASKELNKVIAFFNPSIQGIDKMMREFKANPMKIIFRGIPLTLVTLLLFLVNKDNDYYKEIPEWEKDLFWHIPLTPKKFIRIPKPQELGIIFATIPQRFLEYAYTKDPTAFRELDNTIREQLLLGFPESLIPTAFIPIMELYANKSLFTGLPIVPEREKNIEPKYQYSSNTTEVAKFIGKLLNASPRYIDQAIYDYTGGLGRNALDFIDAIMGKKKSKEIIEIIPGIRSLVSRYPTASQSTTIQRFYDDYNKAEKLLATAKKRYEETGKLYKLSKSEKDFIARIAGDVDNFNAVLSKMRKISRKLSDIRKSIRDIQADESMPTMEKIEKIKELELLQMNIVREFYGEEPLE